MASSKITTGAFFNITRAMAIRCCSPPERYTPFVPITVSAPWGSFSRISSHWALWRAAMISSRVASGLPIRTFSKIEALIRRLFWNTKETVFISSSLAMCFTSTPPIFTCPPCGSKNRQIRLASVVLPPPEGPTKATVCPAGIEREISLMTSFFPS